MQVIRLPTLLLSGDNRYKQYSCRSTAYISHHPDPTTSGLYQRNFAISYRSGKKFRFVASLLTLQGHPGYHSIDITHSQESSSPEEGTAPTGQMSAAYRYQTSLLSVHSSLTCWAGRMSLHKNTLQLLLGSSSECILTQT